jgi:hypothetical protein
MEIELSAAPENLIRPDHEEKIDSPNRSTMDENQPSIFHYKSLRDLIKVSGNILNTNSSKVQMNQNALKFKQNIENNLINPPGSRYECIYKNLLREFRQYYSNKFEEFLKNRINQTESFAKNTKQNKILF